MNLQKKNIGTPDETRTFPKGKAALVKVGDSTLGLATFEPGWKWSECVKPLVKTDSCQVLHTIYQLSGRLHVRMNDGTDSEYGPGDVTPIPSGHDVWRVGDAPTVGLGTTGYQ